MTIKYIPTQNGKGWIQVGRLTRSEEHTDQRIN